ncbi:MAG: hypothetical protein HQK77_13010 [Desulfobacterales bacterium]|nr:hypothetical protein [Desulfobacterales bacterium]
MKTKIGIMLLMVLLTACGKNEESAENQFDGYGKIVKDRMDARQRSKEPTNTKKDNKQGEIKPKEDITKKETREPEERLTEENVILVRASDQKILGYGKAYIDSKGAVKGIQIQKK